MQTFELQTIDIDPLAVLKAQYLGRRDSFPARLIDSAREAIELAQTLVTPAAVYDEFLVQGFDDQAVILGHGDDGREVGRLRIGPKVDLLHPARRVLVSVDTVGPALEKHVDELHAGRQPLEAYMLDSVGVVALSVVGEALRHIAEARAGELNWGVSAALAPGSLVGWSMSGQRDLCALLPLSTIGVRLNDHYVLEPHKSASILIGLGPDYTASRVGSVCRFCSLAGSCWRRRP